MSESFERTLKRACDLADAFAAASGEVAGLEHAADHGTLDAKQEEELRLSRGALGLAKSNLHLALDELARSHDAAWQSYLQASYAGLGALSRSNDGDRFAAAHALRWWQRMLPGAHVGDGIDDFVEGFALGVPLLRKHRRILPALIERDAHRT